MPEARKVAGHIAEMAIAEHYRDGAGNLKVRRSALITPSAIGCVYYQSFDAPSADVRAVQANRPQADGARDATRFIGPKSVQMSGIILANVFDQIPPDSDPFDFNSIQSHLDNLLSYMMPGLDTRLYYRYTGQQDRRFMRVSPRNWTAPIEGHSSARKFSLQWSCPDGLSYRFDTRPTNPGVEGSMPDGRSWRMVYATTAIPGRLYYEDVLGNATPSGHKGGRSFPPIPVQRKDFLYEGSAPAPFVAELQAGLNAITNPRFRVVDTISGAAMEVGLEGYTLASGEKIIFNTGVDGDTSVTGPASFGSGSGNDLYGYVSSPVVWPRLRPGQNIFEFLGAASVSDASARIIYYAADLA